MPNRASRPLVSADSFQHLFVDPHNSFLSPVKSHCVNCRSLSRSLPRTFLGGGRFRRGKSKSLVRNYFGPISKSWQLSSCIIESATRNLESSRVSSLMIRFPSLPCLFLFYSKNIAHDRLAAARKASIRAFRRSRPREDVLRFTIQGFIHTRGRADFRTSCSRLNVLHIVPLRQLTAELRIDHPPSGLGFV